MCSFCPGFILHGLQIKTNLNFFHVFSHLSIQSKQYNFVLSLETSIKKYSLHNTLMGQAILFKTTYNTTETNTFIQTYKELLYIYQHGTLMHNSSNCFIKIQTANVNVNFGLNIQIIIHLLVF